MEEDQVLIVNKNFFKSGGEKHLEKCLTPEMQKYAGEIFLALREYNRLSIKALSEKVSINPNMVQDIEEGNITLTKELFNTLSIGLKTPITTIIIQILNKKTGGKDPLLVILNKIYEKSLSSTQYGETGTRKVDFMIEDLSQN